MTENDIIPTFQDVQVMLSTLTTYVLIDDIAGHLLYDISIENTKSLVSDTKRRCIACAYFIAHLLYIRDNDCERVSSESLDDHSVSYSISDKHVDPWYKLYKEILQSDFIYSTYVYKDDGVDKYDLDTVHDEWGFKHAIRER